MFLHALDGTWSRDGRTQELDKLARFAASMLEEIGISVHASGKRENSESQIQSREVDVAEEDYGKREKRSLPNF